VHSNRGQPCTPALSHDNYWGRAYGLAGSFAAKLALLVYRRAGREAQECTVDPSETVAKTTPEPQNDAVVVTSFYQTLRNVIETLAPFVRSRSDGSLEWDGRRYRSIDSDGGQAGAAAWWYRLTTMVGLLEAQSSPLSTQQLEYLERELFGGMGSLIDFSLDEAKGGPEAVVANERLKRQTDELYEAFKALASGGPKF
jgi:hypothetical protein